MPHGLGHNLGLETHDVGGARVLRPAPWRARLSHRGGGNGGGSPQVTRPGQCARRAQGSARSATCARLRRSVCPRPRLTSRWGAPTAACERIAAHPDCRREGIAAHPDGSKPTHHAPQPAPIPPRARAAGHGDDCGAGLLLCALRDRPRPRRPGHGFPHDLLPAGPSPLRLPAARALPGCEARRARAQALRCTALRSCLCALYARSEGLFCALQSQAEHIVPERLAEFRGFGGARPFLAPRAAYTVCHALSLCGAQCLFPRTRDLRQRPSRAPPWPALTRRGAARQGCGSRITC